MKTILITGASNGIMYNFIKNNKEKYNIIATTRTEKQAQRLKEKGINSFKLDVTNEKDRNKIKNLDIDIYIQNAAIGIGGSIAEIKMDKVRENYETNVFSNFELLQIVLKKMINQNSGRIIIMSSLITMYPIKFLGIYGSTKASIKHLGTCLNKEIKLINKNIKIKIIEPGMYKTGFNQVMLENKYDWMEIESYFKEILDKIRKQETLLTNIVETKKITSITKKIEQAIKENNNKIYYKAPLIQKIPVKLYNIIKN